MLITCVAGFHFRLTMTLLLLHLTRAIFGVYHLELRLQTSSSCQLKSCLVWINGYVVVECDS